MCPVLASLSLLLHKIRHSKDQVRRRLISQLIKDILRVLQKLLKYFNVTAISTSFVLLVWGVFTVIFILDLNDSEFSVASSSYSSLK